MNPDLSRRKRVAVTRLLLLALVVATVKFFPDFQRAWEAAGTPEVSHKGISLRPYLALGTPHFAEVPGFKARLGGRPEGLSPDHFAIVFSGSAESFSDGAYVSPGTVPDFDRANLRFFPVTLYERLWAPENPFDALRSVVASPPESLATIPVGFFFGSGLVPQGAPRRIGFRNGRGFVAVTSPSPGDGRSFHLFQALTDDGKVYVLGIFPVQGGEAEAREVDKMLCSLRVHPVQLPGT